MLRILKLPAPTSIVILFLLEILLLFSTFHAALSLTWVNFNFSPEQFLLYSPKTLLFIGVTALLMFAAIASLMPVHCR